MAEGRMLKKKISLDAAWADLENDTHRMIYESGIALLDIEGRISGDPREFKAAVVPMLEHITREKVLKFFVDAENVGLIIRYKVARKFVVQYPGFKKNQSLRPDKEAPSQYPSLPEDYGSGPGVVREEDGSGPGVVREEDGTTPAEVKGSKKKLSKKNIIAPPKKDNGDASPFYSCNFFEVSLDYRVKLQIEYPLLVDDILRREFSKMEDWVSDNKQKKKFKANGYLANPRLFIKNWLDRLVVSPQEQPRTPRPSIPPEPDDILIFDPNCPNCHGDPFKTMGKCKCARTKGEINAERQASQGHTHI